MPGQWNIVVYVIFVAKWGLPVRIGVDIDGVLADSLSLWINELNSYFKKNKRVEQIRLLDICETYEVTPQELSGFLARRGRYLMTRPEPITGASQYLGMIKKQHDVYIVTARDERYRQETMDWLSKYNLPYDELLLLGSHEKKEACLLPGNIPAQLIVKAFHRGNMLSESIVGQQQFFLRNIGGHGFGPVNHGHMHKFHGPRAGFEFITGIDQDVIPFFFIIALESLLPPG
jgi:5'(3')-deoxyribonucleotidase